MKSTAIMEEATFFIEKLSNEEGEEIEAGDGIDTADANHSAGVRQNVALFHPLPVEPQRAI